MNIKTREYVSLAERLSRTPTIDGAVAFLTEYEARKHKALEHLLAHRNNAVANSTAVELTDSFLKETVVGSFNGVVITRGDSWLLAWLDVLSPEDFDKVSAAVAAIAQRWAEAGGDATKRREAAWQTVEFYEHWMCGGLRALVDERSELTIAVAVAYARSVLRFVQNKKRGPRANKYR